MKVDREKAADVNAKLQAEKAELEAILAKGDTAVQEVEHKAKKIEAEKKELDKKVGDGGTGGKGSWVGTSESILFIKIVPCASTSSTCQ